MEQHGQNILQTFDLAVGYQTGGQVNTLFDNLNLTLHEGNLVCFMGPNGIGKSTLIRTLAGLQNPLVGSISQVSVKEMSVVLTDRVESNLTLFEFVSYGRYPYLSWDVRLKDSDVSIINQCLDQVRVSELREKKLYELSDGQIQMASIARALAQATPLLLLDEPTAHLDLNNRVEIMSLLRKLAHESKKAILVSTHELDLALQTADWIWLATRNKTILTGVPEDLVLGGAFDETFQFKGFDLKTGKILHKASKNKSIELEGNGPTYWWTKNALERTGYSIENGSIIKITCSPENKLWKVDFGKGAQDVSSIDEMLKVLRGQKEF